MEPFDRFRAAAMFVEASIAATAGWEGARGAAARRPAMPVAEEAGGESAFWPGSRSEAARILCGDAVGGYPLVQQARSLESTQLSALGNVAR